jgi:cytochrome d ubiquinol oxidase subunit II
MPFEYQPDLRVHYDGGFLELLTPFPLLVGVVSLAMLIMHGACFLQLRTLDDLKARAAQAARRAALVYLAAFALAGIWLSFGIEGFRITELGDPNQTLTPLQKRVETATGAWLDNYMRWSWLWMVPAVSFAGAIGVVLLSGRRRLPVFLASCAAVAGTLLTAGLSMFPFVMPSSTRPDHSLTLWDVTSSHHTLGLMFWAVVIFLPIIIAYTSWVYRVMRGPISEQDIERDSHTVY